MKEQTRGKRLLSILLACIMMISLVPTVALAANSTLYKHITSGTYTFEDGTTTTCYDFSNDYGTDITLNGTHTINITDTLEYSQSTYGSATALYSLQPLTIGGDGKLVINIDIPKETICSNDKYGIRAKKIVIKDSATVEISIQGGNNKTNGKAYGMYALSGIEIKDSASLNITVSPETTVGYGIYSFNGAIDISGTGEKTINIAKSSFAGVAIDNNGLDTSSNPPENNGDINIAGPGKLKITMPENQGSAIRVLNNANGTVTLNDANVEINGGECGILSRSPQRESDAADVVIKNSTLKIETGKYGIDSYYNGVQFDNSTVNVTATTNAVRLVGRNSSQKNLSKYGIYVSGSKPATLETTGSETIACTADTNHIHDINLSAGGSFTVQGNNNATQGYFKLSDTSECTIGTIYSDDTHKHPTADAYQGNPNSSGVFKIIGKSSGATVNAATPVINTQPISATYAQGDTPNALTVSASVSDGGILSYQWYKNGSAIGGATGKSYTPDISTVGSATYYCIVTNTNSSATGNTTATKQSNLATVTVNAPAHTHSWETTWVSNSTHHWHNCTATGCDITDNSQKNGYAAHTGDWNFSSYTATHHTKALSCCGYKMDEAHYYNSDTDTKCAFCPYQRTIAHTCGASTLTAVAKVDATHFAEGKQAYYKCSCGEYYEDATAATKITNITTWGIIDKTPHQLSAWKNDDSNTKHWKECTIPSCAHKEQEAAHAGGIVSCQVKAICSTCGESYGEFGAHNYDIATWGYMGADGHAHCCKTTGCTEHDTITAHILGAPATETTPQTCTECGYELAAKLIHAPMLVEGYEATITAPGKKDYYHCDSCDKNYADATSMIVIEGDPEVWRVIPMIIAIVEGNGSEWTKGTNADLTFKSNANFANFTWVEVDGVMVATKDYTVTEGSTVVTLKASFLETLSVGEHKIVIKSGSDAPEAKFTVKAAATGGNTGNEQNPDTGATSPQTGDSGNMFLWIALLFVSLGGITTTVISRRKRAK